MPQRPRTSLAEGWQEYWSERLEELWDSPFFLDELDESDKWESGDCEWDWYEEWISESSRKPARGHA